MKIVSTKGKRIYKEERPRMKQALMRSSSKRIFALLLTLVMVFGMLPLSAVADGPKNQIALQGSEILYGDSGNVATNVNDAWVAISKTIEDSAINPSLSENEFLITLDVKTKLDVEEVGFSEDAAVCLVLDVSGSMHRTPGGNGSDTAYPTTSQGGYNASRMKVLKDAVVDFIESYKVVTDNSNASRWISIVLFNRYASAFVLDNGYYWVDVTTTNGYNAVLNFILGSAHTNIGTTYVNGTNGTTVSNGTTTNSGIQATVNSSNYNTNIEAGLAVARNLLRSSGTGVTTGAILPNGGDILNRNVILFTDGEANYCRSTSGSGSSTQGYTVTDLTNLQTPTTGTSSGNGQTNAGRRVTEIRSGAAGSRHNAAVFAIKYGEASQSYLNAIVGSTSVKTGPEIKLIFEDILRDINTFAQAWVITDPMGDYIIWDEVYNEVDRTLPSGADYDDVDNILTWDIKEVAGTLITSGVYENWYQYPQYQYKVTLDTIGAKDVAAAFDSTPVTGGIPSNGDTILTYVIVENGEALTETAQIATFAVPRVFGYCSQFDFIKTDTRGYYFPNASRFALYEGTGTTARLIDDKITPDASGLVSLGNLPSGHTYTLREAEVDEDFWIKNPNDHVISVTYGDISISSADGALTRDATGSYTFENKPAEFIVTVNYYLFIRGAYRLIGSMTKEKNDYLDEDYYQFADTGLDAEVFDSIRYRGNRYYFDYGTNSDMTSVEIYDYEDYDTLEGQIDGKDVVIDLYYRRISLPNIPVEKNINKLSDATYPSDYEFTFALYVENNSGGYTKVTHDLTFTKEQIDDGITQNFDWNLPRRMRVADLRNATLYIREESQANWSSDVMGQYVEYGTLSHLVGFTPYEHEDENGDTFTYVSGITNTYDQPPADPVIYLHKYFVGDSDQLMPEYDGATKVLSCDIESHVHGVDCEGEFCDNCEYFEDTSEGGIYRVKVECTNCGGTGLDEDEDDGICQTCSGYGYTMENCDECNNTGILCTIPENDHEHDDDCYTYIYEFTFALYVGLDKIGEVTIQVTYEDLIDLLDGDGFLEVVFNDDDIIAALRDRLPDPGADPDNYLYVTIVESDGNHNWNPRQNGITVVINPYGRVTYPRLHHHRVNYAKMTNEFDGITIPGFSFTKTVADARSLLGRSLAAYYSGEFTFELRDENGDAIDVYDADGELLSDPDSKQFTVYVEQGIETVYITLPQYIGRDATLTLVEIAGSEVGMTYDTNSFTINILNDTATVAGRLPAVFVNTLLTPITPVAIVNKVVNTDEEIATFSFTWSYEGLGFDDLLSPFAASDSGENTITVNDDSDNYFTIDLPLNFTGQLTITEDTSATMENWVYDSRTTRTINYVFGRPIGRNASDSVTFVNNYYAPGFDISKTAEEEVLVGEEISYTITVTNSGSEDLRNVVITDAMFNDTVAIYHKTLDRYLVEGEDYILDLDEGTITLIDDLEQGDEIIITYTVITGDVTEIENIVYVEAERTITMGENITGNHRRRTRVSRYVSELSVQKSVAAYTDGMDLASTSIIWSSNSISFSSSGNRAAFRVRVTNTGNGTLHISGITDVFGTTDLSGATFYYDNGSGLEAYEGLAALLAVLNDVALSNGDGEIVFYFISEPLTTRDTFTNLVTVAAYDSYQGIHTDSDSASVETSWTIQEYRQRDNTPPPVDEEPPPEEVPPPEEIEDEAPPLGNLPNLPNQQVPLTELPPELTDILDQDTALGNLPQTGLISVLPFGVLGFGAAAMGAAGLFLGKKKEDEEA